MAKHPGNIKNRKTGIFIAYFLIYMVWLSDISGKIMKSDWNGNKLNVSILTSGIYVVKVETDSQTYIKKIIKQ